MLPVVEEAVWRDRQLAIRYLRGSHGTASREATERTVHPLGLVAKGSAWYLVANTADGFRTFRISRIEHATILDAACARPSDFDLATHWKSATTTYQDSLPRYDVTLRVEARIASWLKQWRSAWLAEPMGDAGADGWTTCRVQFECEDEACFLILGFGQRAEVLAPVTLRDRILAEADAIVSRTRASLVQG
jgi:predicted DNA-binding transcriptional regulator YafY